jgi:hypothetical protein
MAWRLRLKPSAQCMPFFTKRFLIASWGSLVTPFGETTPKLRLSSVGGSAGDHGRLKGEYRLMAQLLYGSGSLIGISALAGERCRTCTIFKSAQDTKVAKSAARCACHFGGAVGRASGKVKQRHAQDLEGFASAFTGALENSLPLHANGWQYVFQPNAGQSPEAASRRHRPRENTKMR